jgi:hypothetical protein
MVSQGDYVTPESDKVYRVTEVNNSEGMVRCVSPGYPINDPIVISMEKATEELNRQCGIEHN